MEGIQCRRWFCWARRLSWRKGRKQLTIVPQPLKLPAPLTVPELTKDRNPPAIQGQTVPMPVMVPVP